MSEVASPLKHEPNQTISIKKHEVTFTGSGFEYFKIWIVNIMLMVLTLGIYSAWAKVRNKRYFYGNTQLQGASFEYHASPIQILKGRLIAFVVLLAFTLINNIYPLLTPVTLVLALLALPFVLWSSYRFNTRMSSYRNVHFGFALPLSSAYKYAAIPVLIVMCFVLFLSVLPEYELQQNALLISAVATIAFLLFYFSIPYIMAFSQRLIISNFKYGTSQFTSGIKAPQYYLIFLIWALWASALMVILAAVITLTGSQIFYSLANGPDVFYVATGLLFFIVIFISALQQSYFISRFRNYRFNTTMVKEVQLKSNVKIMPLAFLLFKNSVLVLLTLGLYYPWAKIAMSKLLAESTYLESAESLDQFVASESGKASSLGDELSEAFDTDLDLGAGF